MNTHGIADFAAELQSTCFDLLPACIVSTTFPTVPVPPSMTLGPFATSGYCRDGTFLTYVRQDAASVTLTGADGTYWVALGQDTWTSVAAWNRTAGSHYLWRLSATQPPALDGILPFLQCTVAGGAITAVTPIANAKTPILAQQNANAVAITGGAISLGGHAPTGVLDVQGSVVASDIANVYIGMRLWPVAPSGASDAVVLRAEPMTGASAGTANFTGIHIINQSTSGIVRGLSLNTASAANRHNVYAAGTAQNYFAGNVGIGNATPSYPLDVTGQARVTGDIAFGANFSPFTSARLHMEYPKSTRGALSIRPTDNDTGGAGAILFLNYASAAVVGSISHTASATSFNTSSDVRLKHAVQPLTGALAVLAQLKPVRFRWQADDAPGVGFLAHELMSVVPEAVTGLPDEVNDDGSVKPQQVDHSKVVPWLTAACKDLLAQVEALTTRVTQLEEALGL